MFEIFLPITQWPPPHGQRAEDFEINLLRQKNQRIAQRRQLVQSLVRRKKPNSNVLVVAHGASLPAGFGVGVFRDGLKLQHVVIFAVFGPQFSGVFEHEFPLGPDEFVTASKFVGRGDVTDGGV